MDGSEYKKTTHMIPFSKELILRSVKIQDTITCTSKWLKLKRLIMLNVPEDMEQLELSNIVNIC